MPPSSNSRKASGNRPEKKIGPYPGGIGVAIWTNTIQTDDGPRKIRSISLSPRRYRDAQTGEWKDATSYQVGDLPALIFALQKAQEHCYTNPLEGDASAEEAVVPY